MNRLTITDLKEIINGHRSYSYAEQDRGNALKAFNFLESFSKNNLVYGVNTGFGPMADFTVNKEDQIKQLGEDFEASEVEPASEVEDEKPVDQKEGFVEEDDEGDIDSFFG